MLGSRIPSVATPRGVDRALPTFDEIYATHVGDVERWCLRLCGPYEEVDDFVHDVFIIVHRRLPEWRGEAQITTWLFAVCEMVSRKRRRKQRLSALTSSFERILLSRLASEEPSPFEQLESRESKSRLYELLDSLSDRYRTPLILFEIEGMSGDEVAQLMGIPLPTVWVRLHRGRAKLVALMATALQRDSASKTIR